MNKTNSLSGSYDELFNNAQPFLTKGTVVLVRGLPGSGKSHLAEALRKLTDAEMSVCSADDYFMEGDVYNFDPSKLTEAHLECQSNCFARFSIDDIAFVANTFTMRWEMSQYLLFVETFGLDLLVLNLFDAGLSDKELAARELHSWGPPGSHLSNARALRAQLA